LEQADLEYFFTVQIFTGQINRLISLRTRSDKKTEMLSSVRQNLPPKWKIEFSQMRISQSVKNFQVRGRALRKIEIRG